MTPQIFSRMADKSRGYMCKGTAEESAIVADITEGVPAKQCDKVS